MNRFELQPGTDETHKAPVFLHQGISGVRKNLIDALCPKRETIREIGSHGSDEIIIERDSLGRIVRETTVPQSRVTCFFNYQIKGGVEYKNRAIDPNEAGATVISYEYQGDTGVITKETKRSYISTDFMGALSSTTTTKYQYTDEGQLNTIDTQFEGATSGKKIMIHHSQVLERDTNKRPLSLKIDREHEGQVTSIRRTRKYDDTGNLAEETDHPWIEEGTTSPLRESKMTYDTQQRITKAQTLEGGETTVFEYTYEDLPDGGKVITRKSFTNGKEEISERAEFDNNGKQTSYSTKLAPEHKGLETRWEQAA